MTATKMPSVPVTVPAASSVDRVLGQTIVFLWILYLVVNVAV